MKHLQFIDNPLNKMCRKKDNIIKSFNRNWAELGRSERASERDLKMMKMIIFSLKRSQCEYLSWY